MPSRTSRSWLCLVSLRLFFRGALGSKEFVCRQGSNASTYPCHDAHPIEKVTAAVDLYNSSPKADIFTTHYSDEGILPVFLVITNDGDKPISVNNMQAQLVTGRRTKLEALDADDIMRRIGPCLGNSSNPSPTSAPLPFPEAPRTRRRSSSTRRLPREVSGCGGRAACNPVGIPFLRRGGCEPAGGRRPRLPDRAPQWQWQRVNVFRNPGDSVECGGGREIIDALREFRYAYV